jgi:hypothetical protein
LDGCINFCYPLLRRPFFIVVDEIAGYDTKEDKLDVKVATDRVKDFWAKCLNEASRSPHAFVYMCGKSRVRADCIAVSN